MAFAFLTTESNLTVPLSRYNSLYPEAVVAQDNELVLAYYSDVTCNSENLQNYGSFYVMRCPSEDQSQETTRLFDLSADGCTVNITINSPESCPKVKACSFLFF